jgi:hypothetical protein
MDRVNETKQRTWTTGRIVALSSFLLFILAAFFLYRNFNRFLSESLLKTFNSHIISDVYELSFENLRVNIWDGSIRVMKVSILPREKPLKEYPYINSSFRLSTDELYLEQVAITDLIRTNTLNMERISIVRPSIDLVLDGSRIILLPFSDSTATDQPKGESKKVIEYLLLQSFELIDARFHSNNLTKSREFRVEGLSFRMDSLQIKQRPGVDILALRQGELRIKSFDGRMSHGAFRHLEFQDFTLAVDSLGLQNTIDTLIYKTRDARLLVNNVDMQTKDSLFHAALKSFELSTREKSIRMRGIQFKPIASFESMQKKYAFVHTDVAVSIGSLEVDKLDLFTLMHSRKLLIDEVRLDSVEAVLFADLVKPRDPKKTPPYLGQTVTGIPLPLQVRKVRATHVHLTNRERKPDSTMAEVHLNEATVEVNNITNMSSADPLVLEAQALLAGKVHFKATVAFEYRKPQFRFDGVLKKFNFPDLNPVIEAYTPAKVTNGVVDQISFSGVAGATSSIGTMKFLYHDLEVDVHLKKKAKWMSSLLAFTANQALHESNPPSDKLPPKEVKFMVDRDPRKGFINLLLKSLLNGLKETMFMSKDNKKAYKEAKKKFKE